MRRWILERSYLFGLLGEATVGVLSEPVRTPGALYLPRSYVIIEDPWRQNRPHVSCIPEGTYYIEWGNFPKRGWCLYVDGVPGRTAIQIHVGNDTDDTEGCLLPNLAFSLEGERPHGVSSGQAVSQINASIRRDERVEFVVTHYHPQS